MCDTYIPNKTIALIKGKCPRCQSGQMFKYHAVKLNKFTEMYETCPVCELRFEIEPGFFWGSMYVSYAITTGMMLVLGALTFLIGHNPDFWWYISVICGSVILTTPFIYRYSRLLMIYLFSPVRFDGKYANKR